MQLKSVRLTDVELKQPLKIFTDNSRNYGAWEVEPSFNLGQNDKGQFIQEVSIEIIKTIGTQHAKIIVTTFFELELNSKEFIPTSDQDFIEYASFQQIAIAHARAFFIRETRGTKFAGEILPVDNFYHAMQKVKLAVFNTNRLN